MPIYKYTLKKYTKSYSTWIIMAITAILIFFMAGFLPFRVFAPKNAEKYSKTALILIPTMTVFLSIFSSVFSGFKSANMFKDEVEDGTFLIMISKPIPRSSILIYKWLSLQTFLLAYSIFTSAFLVVTLAIFDNGSQIPNLNTFSGLKTLRENGFIIFGFISIILYVMSLTFSSIAILLSTRLSVSTTVGISIALGVVIPITSLVRTFTQDKENSIVINSSFFNKLDRILNELKEKEVIKSVQDDIKKINEKYKNSKDPTEHQFHNLTNLINFKANINKYHQNLSSLASDPRNIYSIGVGTNEKNSYKNLWFLDTHFQISKLSSLVYDEIIPNSLQQELTSPYSRVASYNHSIHDDIFNTNLPTQGSLKKLDDFIEFSWSKTKEMRADFLSLWLILMIMNKREIQDSFAKSNDKDFKEMVNFHYWRFMENFQPILNLPLLDKELDKNWRVHNNAKFNDDNFFLHVLKVIQWVHESKKQQDENKSKKIFYLWRLLIALHNQQTLRRNIKINKGDFSSLFYSLSAMAYRFLNPIESSNGLNLDMVFTDKKLSDWKTSKFLKNSIKTKYNEKTKHQEIDFAKAPKEGYNFTKVYVYTLLNQATFVDWAYKAQHGKLNRLIAAKVQFNRVVRREYASKYEILGIFSGVAIALIPITYWSIRKKDFK